MDRKNFFFKQPVSELEFNSAFTAAEAAIWNQWKDRGAYGIVSGFVPTAPGAWNISFSAGKGVDKNGARLSTTGTLTQSILTATDGSATAPSAGNRRWISIYGRSGQGTGVGQGRNLTDARIDGNGAPIMFSAAEALNANDTTAQLNKLLIVKGAEDLIGNPYAARPALDASAILLADVILTAGDASLLISKVDTSRAERFGNVVGWSMPGGTEFSGVDPTQYVSLVDAPGNGTARCRIYTSAEGIVITRNAFWSAYRWNADDTADTASATYFTTNGIEIRVRHVTAAPWLDLSPDPTGWDALTKLRSTTAGDYLDLNPSGDITSHGSQSAHFYTFFEGVPVQGATVQFPKTFSAPPSSITVSTAGMGADFVGSGGTVLSVNVVGVHANGAGVKVTSSNSAGTEIERNVIATY